MSSEDSQSAVVDEVPEAEDRLELQVSIREMGACRKHVSVTVSQSDVQSIRDEAIEELSVKAQVPGFRTGKVPAALLQAIQGGNRRGHQTKGVVGESGAVVRRARYRAHQSAED